MYCWTNMFLCFLFMLILILTLLKIGATDLACSYLFSGMQPQEHRIHSWGCCIYRSRNQGIMKCSTCISIGNRTFIVKNEVLWIKRITIFVFYHKICIQILGNVNHSNFFVYWNFRLLRCCDSVFLS